MGALKESQPSLQAGQFPAHHPPPPRRLLLNLPPLQSQARLRIVDFCDRFPFCLRFFFCARFP
jgi:hypothetical protein